MIVIATSIDRGSEEKVRTLLKSYVSLKNLSSLNLLDPESSIASQYGVRGVPINFFINPQGTVVALPTGYRKWESREALMMFEELLSEAT